MTTERAYLREVQYRDDSNLNARAELHRRFSVDRRGLQPWTFDQLELPPDGRLLEVGCGPGMLWTANAGRVPEGWRVVLSDFSPGMARAARARLPDRPYAFEVADVEALPHPSGSFHAVVANHMLYHVPDRRTAIGELARVLRPDGALYALTNGRDHLRELEELVSAWAPSVTATAVSAFGLENGGSQLAASFGRVELRRRRDWLEVKKVEPLVAYVRSTPGGGRVDLEAVREAAAQAIGRDGVFRVRKDTGLFIARSPIQSRS